MATKKTKVEVYGETSKYERSMRNVKRTSRSTSQAIGGHWSKTFGTLTKLSAMFGVAGAAGFAMLGKSAIGAASDLEEVSSKFNVVFGDLKAVAGDWSDTLVDSYAMSTTESLKYLSSVQDLLKPMGMQSEAAANLSFEIVKLSADLGSFNNLPTERVMGDIQSALVGNYETMKKYGVVLNATTVQQTALNMGLAESKDMLTAADKAQAAYTLMVTGSADAIGDMARTSDSYANQIKKLKANLVDLQATFGETLLPIATDIVTQFNQWVKANDKFLTQDMPKYIDAITGSIKGASKALDYLLDIWTGPIAGDPKELAKQGLEKELRLAQRSYQLMVDQGNIDQEVLRAAEARIFTLRQRISILEEGIRGRAETPTTPAGPVNLNIRGPGQTIDRGEAESYQQLTDDMLGLTVLRGEQMMELDMVQAELLAEQQMAMATTGLEQKSQLETYMAGLLYNDLESMRWGHAQRMVAIEQEEANRKKEIQMLYFNLGSAIGNAAIVMATKQGKAQFIAQKTFQVGMAFMSAWLAHNQALATPPGPPYTIPLAEFVLKKGLLGAAAIAAASIGQIAGGGGAASGGGGPVGTFPASPTTGWPLTPTGETETKGTLIINIEGDMIGDEGYVEMLAEKISEAVENRDVRLVASNSMSADQVI